MKRLVAILLAVSMLSLGAATARANDPYDSDGHSQPIRYADEYEYEDAFSNPLRLGYYLIYPIGYTVEWLVMRPFHYVISRPGLDKFFGFTPIGEEGSYDRMGERM